GREFTTDLDYMRYTTFNHPEFVNTTMTAGGVKKYDEFLKGDLPMDINIISARIDYTHPIKKGKLEAGLKSSSVKTINKANYFELYDESWEKDYKRTNFFDYNENIHAAYINLN